MPEVVRRLLLRLARGRVARLLETPTRPIGEGHGATTIHRATGTGKAGKWCIEGPDSTQVVDGQARKPFRPAT